ncbi:MAG TPA: hypothetical protein VGA02_06180 [Gemmatimonadales bacterium]
MTGRDDLTSAVASVARTLDAFRVPYFVTGSLAASTHAEFRATNDIDIVADFSAVDLRALMREFDTEFHADVEQAVSCIREGQSFNLIHRVSFLKVDFFPAVSAFNRIAIERAESVVLGTDGPAVRVASREDILLAKLHWYRLGDESSELQRRDITGIVALNRDLFDRAYLRHWAGKLGVQDLLDRLLGSGPDRT